MSKWLKLLRLCWHYVHDEFDAYPENDHEIDVINQLITMRELSAPKIKEVNNESKNSKGYN